MRILDEDSNRATRRVILLLTLDEARELRDALAGLVEQPSRNHAHVADPEYQWEVTVAVYSPTELQHFSDRVKTLITRGE